MGRFDTIKTTIDANIKENGSQEITGQKMNSILTEIVNATDAELTELESELGFYEENPEYIRAYTDGERRLLFAIKTDGSIEWAKGIPTPIAEAFKDVIKDIQDNNARISELGTEYLASEEYIRAYTDKEGKFLWGIKTDGSIEWAKGIPTPIAEQIKRFSDVESSEYMDITTDADGKILESRNANGVHYESKASFGELLLSDKNAASIVEALKKAGFNASTMDWSDESLVEIPVPSVAARINLIVTSMASTKTDDIEGYMEFYDKQGNYFKKAIVLNAQGSSSMGYYVKNQSIDIADGSKIKFGDWVSQDSFHMKKYYIDAFRGQCVVGYWLMAQIYDGKMPWSGIVNNGSLVEGNGDLRKDFPTGAKAHPDGFPVVVYLNGKYQGLYAFCLKKHRDNYFCKKSNPKNIILDGSLGVDTFWGKSEISWSAFEIRNPKDLVDVNGAEYDGDNPTELSGTDALSSEVKGYIQRLAASTTALQNNPTKETFEEYFMVEPMIDYFLLSNVLYHFDGFRKNWIWVTWDGIHWTPTAYDLDSIFGMHTTGTYAMVSQSEIGTSWGLPTYWLKELYEEEISLRYKELKNKGIFSTHNIVGLLKRWCNLCGYDNMVEELEKYNQTPSYRKTTLNENWKLLGFNDSGNPPAAYDSEIQYNAGDDVLYKDFKYRALNSVKGIAPADFTYSQFPQTMGFFNSISRVENWLNHRLSGLDSIYV